MKDSFKENIEWNVEQIAVQVVHAQNVSGMERNGYYKAAVILAASVVEALAYRILEQNRHFKMPLEEWKCKSCNPLPERYKSINGNGLSICERYQSRFKLNKQTDFKKVNEICLNLGIFSDSFFVSIEKVRNLRNKIHIQGLDDLDGIYTKEDVESVSLVMNELLKKIK